MMPSLHVDLLVALNRLGRRKLNDAPEDSVEYDKTLPQVYMTIARLEGVNINPENSAEARQNAIDELAANAAAFRRGEERNRVV